MQQQKGGRAIFRKWLSYFQVKPDGSFQEVKQNSDGIYTVGNWNISAQMDVSKPANIQVWDTEKTEMLVSDGVLNFDGKTFRGKELSCSKLIEMKNGKAVFMEATDEFRASIKRVMQREKVVGLNH